MKIIVCIKQVPDSAAKMTVSDGRVSWGDAPLVLNPWDEFAVEAALLQKEAHGGEVTALSVGEESAKEALKTALAMGCTDAVLVSDPALKGTDSVAVAQVLAAAIKKIGAADAVFFGRQAIDGDMGLTNTQAARFLDWPVLNLVSAVQIDPASGSVRAERAIEEGRQIVESKLPAVFSVSKDIGEPRYPSFMGIRKASKAVIPIWSLGDLGLQAPKGVVDWSNVEEAPVRQVVTEMVTGGSPKEIAEKLADKILGEKVL